MTKKRWDIQFSFVIHGGVSRTVEADTLEGAQAIADEIASNDCADFTVEEIQEAIHDDGIFECEVIDVKEKQSVEAGQ